MMQNQSKSADFGPKTGKISFNIETFNYNFFAINKLKATFAVVICIIAECWICLSHMLL